jgi:hypothetical protein
MLLDPLHNLGILHDLDQDRTVLLYPVRTCGRSGLAGRNLLTDSSLQRMERFGGCSLGEFRES